MAEISPAAVKEVEELKDRIGWSWLMISAKLDWAPFHLTRFRTMKMAIPDDAMRYLREVAAAVASVRPISPDQAIRAIEAKPEPFIGESIGGFERVASAARDEVTERLSRARFHPEPGTPGLGGIAHSGTREVRVMMLDDIATKIANRYRALQDGADPASAEMSPAERAGAIWMIGELAAELGVSEEVCKLIAAQAAPPAPQPARDWTVPGLERRPLS